MSEEKIKFLNSIKFPLLFIILIWVIKVAEHLGDFSLVGYGLYPREITGLIGVLTFPLIHGSWDHLVSNTIPMLILSSGLFYFYPSASKRVLSILYFLPSLLLWLFARPSFHIGASAIIYGLASFMFFSGIIRKDKRAIVLALLTTFLYGSLIWGVLPIKEGVSWEGHLFGVFSGILAAFLFRKYDPYKKYDWEDDDDDDYDVRKLEVSYKNGYPFN